jgi:glycosyltransferase involved in cell wall biosynthesis
MRSWWPFRLVVWGIHRFATGPEAMVAYYRDEVGVPERKLVCLYNDIRVEQYRNRIDRADRQAERSRLGASEATNVLLYVHRLSPVRRSVAYVSRLLDALRDPGHGPWILVFAGGGPEQGKLQEMIARSGLGDRCRMLGNVPAGELPALYSAADIFLNPTYTEGFPRVILEAMVAGLPIVTTDAGGTAELLGPLQQRFVVPRQQADRFALGVLEVMGDRELQARLGRENLEAVRRFDTEPVALMYEKELFG